MAASNTTRKKKEEENTWKPSDRAAAMFSHRIASAIIAWFALHPAAWCKSGKVEAGGSGALKKSPVSRA